MRLRNSPKAATRWKRRLQIRALEKPSAFHPLAQSSVNRWGRCASAILGFGNRGSGQIRFYYKGSKGPNVRRGSILRKFQQGLNNTKGENRMKKLLLIALAAMGLLLVPVQRSDAQITIGVGGVGFGYPGYRYGYYGSGYYPYGYYRPYRSYSYYSGPSYYWSNGHRYYRHHRHHHYYRY